MRPLRDETFEEARDRAFTSIHINQNLIKALKKSIIFNDKMPDDLKILAKEGVTKFNKEIKQTYADLKEMQSWWIKEGKKQREQEKY